jgi:hypothetical protein
MEGPNLGALIVVIQSSSHFVLGAGTYSNSLTMGLAHAISGVGSYFLIKHSDEVWNIFFNLIEKLFSPYFFRFSQIGVLASTSACSETDRKLVKLFLTKNPLRAPPYKRGVANEA